MKVLSVLQKLQFILLVEISGIHVSETWHSKQYDEKKLFRWIEEELREKNMKIELTPRIMIYLLNSMELHLRRLWPGKEKELLKTYLSGI
jgi:DNA polymerase III delta subunit